MAENNWRRIPKDRMATVSYRKWMRLKSQFDLKVLASSKELEKELKKMCGIHEKRVENAQAALSNALDKAIYWMDKYEALASKEKV